jgi:NAD(P)-dependent dehydrogenase (short-subunit alcohol dehydrogenase family)
MTGLSPRPLSGQVALVTGAADGIGRAISVILARAGARLALVDRDAAGLAGTATAVGEEESDASCHHADLARREAVAPLVEAALARWGQIDILVNCAGITGPSSGILEIGLDDWDLVLAINLTAPFMLIKHVAPQMMARGAGRIVNVTSSSAHRAQLSLPAYGASKSGLMQLTRSAAAELGAHGITVNAVAPGLTETGILTSRFTRGEIDAMVRSGPLSNLLDRLTLPEDVAGAVLFLCLPESRQITAQTLHVSAGAIV